MSARRCSMQEAVEFFSRIPAEELRTISQEVATRALLRTRIRPKSNRISKRQRQHQ